MENKNLFQIAKENAKYKECEGCGEIKTISSFKKRNKYCTGCSYVKEIRERYSDNNLNDISKIKDKDIEDINLDDFFDDL